MTTTTYARGEMSWTFGMDLGRSIFEAIKPVLEGLSFYSFKVDLGIMAGNAVVTISFDDSDPTNPEVRCGAAEMVISYLAEALAKSAAKLATKGGA